MTTKENIKAILACNFSGFKDEYIETATDRIMETVKTTCANCDYCYSNGYTAGYLKGKEEITRGKTDCVTICDGFGNKISGYMDETRNLIFSRYGIVTLELLLQKQYTVIKDKEFGGGEQ